MCDLKSEKKTELISRAKSIANGFIIMHEFCQYESSLPVVILSNSHCLLHLFDMVHRSSAHLTNGYIDNGFEGRKLVQEVEHTIVQLYYSQVS